MPPGLARAPAPRSGPHEPVPDDDPPARRSRSSLEDDPESTSPTCVGTTGRPHLFWVLAVVVFLQFFTRYVLNDSVAWTEEIARYLLIGVTFIGASWRPASRATSRSSSSTAGSPRNGRRMAQAAIDLDSMAFFATLACFSDGQIAGRTMQMMVSIDVPKSMIYWSSSACFAA
jgi:TRAP-type C4-dicarboxylate transport system permease small subunit